MIRLTPQATGIKDHPGLLSQRTPCVAFAFRNDGPEKLERDVRGCTEGDTAYGFVRGGGATIYDERNSYRLLPNGWFVLPGLRRIELATGARGFVGILRGHRADIGIGYPGNLFSNVELTRSYDGEKRVASMWIVNEEIDEPAVSPPLDGCMPHVFMVLRGTGSAWGNPMEKGEPAEAGDVFAFQDDDPGFTATPQTTIVAWACG
jgi:hypothetical protein